MGPPFLIVVVGDDWVCILRSQKPNLRCHEFGVELGFRLVRVFRLDDNVEGFSRDQIAIHFFLLWVVHPPAGGGQMSTDRGEPVKGACARITLDRRGAKPPLHL